MRVNCLALRTKRKGSQARDRSRTGRIKTETLLLPYCSARLANWKLENNTSAYRVIVIGHIRIKMNKIRNELIFQQKQQNDKKEIKPTIGDKIVDTFTFFTPYFVTMIPFFSPSLSFQPPFPPNNVVPQLLWSWGANKQHWMGEQGVFHSLLREKMSGVIWCSKSAMERQCVN